MGRALHSCIPNTACLVVALLATACVQYEPVALDPTTETAALRSRRPEDAAVTAAETATSSAFNPVDGFDEGEVVAIALALNPALRAKRLNIGEADALLIAAGIWPNPRLDLSMRAGTSGTPGLAVDLDLLFELLRRGEREARRGAAEAQVDSAHAEIAAEEFRVAARARRARLAALAKEESLRLLEREVALREDVFTQMQRRRDLGEGTDLDVAIVEMERAAARRDLRNAQSEHEQARIALNQQLGLPPEFPLALADSGRPFRTTLVQDLDDAEIDRRILSDRLDLRAKETEYRQAEEELRLAVARQVPGLSIGPAAEREVGGDTTLGVGSSIEIPFFDRNQAEIAEKQAARERVRGEYVAALQQARGEAIGARALLRRVRTEIDTQTKDLVPLLRRNDELFEGAFRARELSVLEWLTARSRTAASRREFVAALVRHAEAVIELESAIGGRLPLEPDARAVEALEDR